MGEAAEKLSGKLGIDTTDFKTGISSANRELRILESGFRAGVAALGDWSNSATGLESRIQSLTSQIDIQKLKVAALREEYNRVATEKGENSRAAQDLEIKLNKETETLGKMENELGETETALQDVESGSNEAGDAAEEAGGKFEGFGAVLTGTLGIAKGLAVGLLAVLGIIVALSAAAIGLTFSSAAAADEIATLSVQTGIGTDRLQEMKYAGDQLGFSLDTVTGANARLIRSMDTASQQTEDYQQKVEEAAAAGKDIEDIELGEAAQAFETLGVEVTDLNGDLRDSEEVFNETIDALGKIENPAERDALAMQIFGKSAQELNPLIKAGSEELARLSEEARKNGAVVSTETITALAGLQDQLDGLKGGLLGVGMTLAGTFAPFFSGVLGQAQGYLQELVQIISGSGGDFGKMAEGLAGLFTTIAGDIASQAPAMLDAGLSILQAILDAIIGALPQLLTAATEILSSLVNFIAQALPQLIPAAIQILLMLVNAILQNLPILIEAALQAIIALADGLASALPTLIPAVVQAVITIVQTLIKNLPMLVNAALQLIMALAQGLIAALPILIAAIPELVNALVDALIVALPMIIEVSGELIVALVDGILNNLPALGSAAIEIIMALARGLSVALKAIIFPKGTEAVEELLVGIISGAQKLAQGGAELIRNVGVGITNGLAAIGDFGASLYSKISESINRIKASLLTIGKAIVEGVWQGIQNAQAWFYGLIYDFFSGMVATVLGVLGIQSPSKVGFGIGRNFIGSVGLGGMREFERVEQQFRAGFANLANAFSPVSSPALAAAPASSGDTYNIYLWGASMGQRNPNTPLGDILKEFNVR